MPADTIPLIHSAGFVRSAIMALRKHATTRRTVAGTPSAQGERKTAGKSGGSRQPGVV
jgi:hypothetical protein